MLESKECNGNDQEIEHHRHDHDVNSKEEVSGEVAAQYPDAGNHGAGNY